MTEHLPGGRRGRSLQTALARLCLLAGLWVALEAPARGQERSWLLLPFMIRLEGIAPIYGLGAGVRDAIGGRVDAFAAVSVGGAEAQGAFVRDIPLGGGGLALHLYGAQVSRAEFLSSFTRGTARDRPVSQQVSGSGYAATVEAVSSSRVFQLTAGLAQSTVKLEGFSTRSGADIHLPGAVLHDIETTSILLGLGADWTDAPRLPTRGVRLGVDALTAQGRAGQSDTLTLTYRASGFIPLGRVVTWALHAMASDAGVLRREARYDTPAEVAGALEINCAAVPDGSGRARCQALADQLAAYIAANNRHGTALPIGGSVYLRGFRELRFRAAHTRVAATELRWRLSESFGWERFQGPDSAVEAAAFWEAGQAADALEELSRNTLGSAGAGLRVTWRGLPVRLEAARGGEQSAWFLTVGYPW